MDDFHPSKKVYDQVDQAYEQVYDQEPGQEQVYDDQQQYEQQGNEQYEQQEYHHEQEHHQQDEHPQQEYHEQEYQEQHAEQGEYQVRNIYTNMFGDDRNILRNILIRLNMTKHNTNNMNTTNNKMVANRLNIEPNMPNIRNHILRSINLFMKNMFKKVTNKNKMFLNKNTNSSSISNSV
jgi:hypothetical protein